MDVAGYFGSQSLLHCAIINYKAGEIENTLSKIYENTYLKQNLKE